MMEMVIRIVCMNMTMIASLTIDAIVTSMEQALSAIAFGVTRLPMPSGVGCH